MENLESHEIEEFHFLNYCQFWEVIENYSYAS